MNDRTFEAAVDEAYREVLRNLCVNYMHDRQAGLFPDEEKRLAVLRRSIETLREARNALTKLLF